MASVYNPPEYQTVAEFYSGKSVFIIGASGFIGKVLLEKLIYSCPNIRNVYVLLRADRNTSIENKLGKILESPIFGRLREKQNGNLEKIIPVVGDITQDNIGISEKDKIIIWNEVSAVFHLAATVKFNEKLPQALQINVEGTRKVIRFCHGIKNIRVFSYLSTIFSNTGNGKSCVDEILYTPPISLDEVWTCITQNKITDQSNDSIIDGHPNTYTFSKMYAEEVVVQESKDIPVVIVRPSAVTPALGEPLWGWTDTWNGPTPILTLYAKGWARCMYGKPDYPFEIIPVDYVSNLIIVSATRFDQQRSNNVQVLHSCTSSSNPLKLRDAAAYYLREARKNGFNELYLTSMIFLYSWTILKILSFFLHVLPAFIYDMILRLQGKSPRYIHMQKKMSSYMKTIRHFSSQRWCMSTSKTQELFAKLSDQDRNIFPFDPRLIKWEEYFTTYFNGVKLYLIDSKRNSTIV